MSEALNENNVPRRAEQKAKTEQALTPETLLGGTHEHAESTDSIKSSGAKLYDSLSHEEQLAAAKRTHDQSASGAAAEILSLNPLANKGDKVSDAPTPDKPVQQAPEQFKFDKNSTNFSDFLNHGESQTGLMGDLSYVWKDIFDNSNTRNIGSFSQLGGVPSNGLFTPAENRDLKFDLGPQDSNLQSHFPGLVDNSSAFFAKRGNFDLSSALKA